MLENEAAKRIAGVRLAMEMALDEGCAEGAVSVDLAATVRLDLEAMRQGEEALLGRRVVDLLNGSALIETLKTAYTTLSAHAGTDTWSRVDDEVLIKLRRTVDNLLDGAGS